MACRDWTRLAAAVALCGFLGIRPFSAQDSSSVTGEDPQAIIENATDLLRQGQLDRSRQILEDLLQSLPDSGEEARKSAALNRLSLIAANQGRYFEAVRTARQAAEESERVGDEEGLGVSLNNLGRAQLLLGRYQQARNSFSQALQISQRAQDLRRSVLRLNNVANTYFYEGRYLEALTHYQRAIDALSQEDSPQPALQRVSWTNMAVLYQKLGQWERALDLYQRVARLEVSAAPSQQAQLLSNQGTLYRRLGDPVLAGEAYQQALKLFRESGDLDGELGVLKNLGILQALALDDLEAARRTFSQVAERAQRALNRREEAQARLYLGETLHRLGLEQEAEKELNAALRLSRQAGLSEETWKALFGLGRLSDSEDEAEERFRQALSIVESVRSRLGGSSLRSEFLADKKALYDHLVARVLESSEAGRLLSAGGARERPLEEALRLMESSRARNFQDQLGEALQQRRGRGDDQTAGRLKEIASRIETLNSSLLLAEGEEAQRIEAELSEMESEYAALEARSRSQEGSAYSSDDRSQPSQIDFAVLRRQLPEDALLLTYWLGGSRLVILALERGHSSFSVQPWTQAQSLLLQECRQALSNPRRQDWRDTCRPLAAQLLDEVLRRHPSPSRLLMVPDGTLALLPLEALPDGQDSLLLERRAVGYLPAASLLGRLPPVERQLWPWQRSLVAFGDPVIPQRAPGESEESWPGLPYSATEVRLIEETVSGHVRLFLGKDAEKRHLQEPALKRFPILHLSTHAAIDTDYPERSRILFSPSSEEPLQPRYLFLSEVLQLDLSGTDLVTLSACDTARGRELRGEGLLDFSRAFLIAGARSTVAGLWKVSDQAAALFMARFYAYLMDGQSKAEALRQAKLNLLRSQGDYSHPFYWAAFVLNGDGFTPAPLPYRWSTLLLAVALPLLILSLLALRRRFRPGRSAP
ncbi:MAG TPA: CHAT domain-containing protein [Acidobacteriota bacterium]|nr:CHAT domain-containing protein [Acidobacteriota bacterium]